MAQAQLHSRLESLTKALRKNTAAHGTLHDLLSRLEAVIRSHESPGKSSQKLIEQAPSHSGQIPEGPLPDDNAKVQDGREAKRLPKSAVPHDPSPASGQVRLARSRVESPAFVQRAGQIRPWR